MSPMPHTAASIAAARAARQRGYTTNGESMNSGVAHFASQKSATSAPANTGFTEIKKALTASHALMACKRITLGSTHDLS